MGVGVAFAGSPGEIASGVRIDGIDVAGLTPAQAQANLEARSATLATAPVTFVAAGRRFTIRPVELGVTVDWAAAVASASRAGDGNGVVRGLRRVGLRLFPKDITPLVSAYDAAVDYEVSRLADTIDRPHQEARLVRRGLVVGIVPGKSGHVLDRVTASRVIVATLAAPPRSPVNLPVKTDPPKRSGASLRPTLALARRVVSAPVMLELGSTRIELDQTRLAAMLQLPAAGGALALDGAAATRYFAGLGRTLSRPPRPATFAVSGAHVRIVPSTPGLALDVPRTATAVLAAAERPRGRIARLAVAEIEAARTTAAAAAMGITGLVGTYETFYGGVPNRIHNVDLVARLIDKHFVAPGATFSFNATTGERTAAKGFLEAPVIISGELSTGLGGGICQVSTTVFNAAFEAGLPITARTNHALYISHYPLGRDATVNYPDTDLKFLNDTDHWILLRTFVESSSLVVSLYGTPQHRRVVTEAAPLRFVSPPPIKRKTDLALKPGEHVVDDPGVPAEATSVHRLVYDRHGKLLSDATWVSNYVASPKLVRIGPKEKTKAVTPKKAAAPAATTTQR